MCDGMTTEPFSPSVNFTAKCQNKFLCLLQREHGNHTAGCALLKVLFCIPEILAGSPLLPPLSIFFKHNISNKSCVAGSGAVCSLPFDSDFPQRASISLAAPSSLGNSTSERTSGVPFLSQCWLLLPLPCTPQFKVNRRLISLWFH